MADLTKCNSIRPNYIVSDQSGAVSSIETSLLNLGRSAPVSPVNEAVKAEIL